MFRFRRGRLAVVPFSRVSFRGRGACRRSWDPHHVPGLAPVPGIPTGLATRRSTGTSTSLWISTRSRDPYQLSRSAPVSRLTPVPGISTSLATRRSTGTATSFESPPGPGIPTSSRDPHQSRDSHQLPESTPISRLAEALGPPPVLNLHQSPGSLPALGIRTASQDPHQSRDSHPFPGSPPALGSHTSSRDPYRFGAFRLGTDPENWCSGGISVCRHAPSCRWYTPPLGTSPRSPATRKPQYIKATKSGAVPWICA